MAPRIGIGFAAESGPRSRAVATFGQLAAGRSLTIGEFKQGKSRGVTKRMNSRAERRAAPKPARLAMCARLNAASIAVPLYLSNQAFGGTR
ncbi:hypothetical protein [Roseateles sp. P5_E7]